MRTSRLRRQVLQRGFSYLWLLFVLVLGGVALAALGEQTRVEVQREQESELLYRGGEIRRALQSYRGVAVPGQRAAFPASLQELLDDPRLPEPKYHLRRLYADPFTGRADWALLRDGEGGIVGVHSRSNRVALMRHALPVAVVRDGERAPGSEVRIDEWHFVAEATAAASPRAPAAAGVR